MTTITNASLERTYRAALLLSGSAAYAEVAMLDAIGALEESGPSEEDLLRGAIEAAIEWAGEASPYDSAVSPELQRVLELPAQRRQCYVLRILEGMPRPECARLLNLSVSTLDERTCEAARALAEDAAGLLEPCGVAMAAGR